MNQFTVTFKHVYLLMDLHAAPLVPITLSASRLKCAMELESIGLLEVKDNRYYLTEPANDLVQSFGHRIQDFQRARTA